MGKKENKKEKRKEGKKLCLVRERKRKNSFLFLLAKIFVGFAYFIIIVGFLFVLLAFFFLNVGKEKKIISKPFYFIFFFLDSGFAKIFVSFENLVEMIKKKLGSNTLTKNKVGWKVWKKLGGKGLREKEISRRRHERTRTLN
jgi:hypothetical protein